MRTSVRVLIGAMFVGALVLAGCGAAGPTEAPAGSAGMDALMVGKLSRDSGTGCVWLVPEENPQGGMVVNWPDGIEARSDPVRLVDRSGAVIAREGDTVRMAGGAGHVDAPRDPQCPPGPVIIAHRIVSVGPPTTPPPSPR